jgi:altronate dehydratase
MASRTAQRRLQRTATLHFLQDTTMAQDVKLARALMVMHAKDNVAVCLRPIEGGEEVELVHDGRTTSIKVATAVPLGHKVALAPVASGQPIVKYGEVIGRATRDIATGQHVHDHNISDY